MNFLKKLVLLSLTCSTLTAVAGSASDALSVCFAENTTGKERKELAQWIFLAMAIHPDIKSLAPTLDKDREAVDQTIGFLVTRLIGENCSSQTQLAIQADGSEAMKTAFGTLGQLAMRELMSNNDVNAALTHYEKFLDHKKVDSAIRGH